MTLITPIYFMWTFFLYGGNGNVLSDPEEQEAPDYQDW